MLSSTTFSWIVSAATNHDVLVYGLVIILACAEGPLVSLILGVLLQLGFVYFIPSFVALIVGDLIGDTVWYFIGRKYGNRFITRFGPRFKVTQQKIDHMTKLFHRYRHRVLFISKISNGLGLSLVTLMTAGMARIPFVEYLSVNLLGQFIWTSIMLSLGYYFSSAFVTINNWVGRISLIGGLLIVLFFAYKYWKYLKKQAENINI